MKAVTPSKARQKSRLKRYLLENVELYAMLIPTLVLIFIFEYLPIGGVAIAFQDYSPAAGVFSSKVEWVGLKHFINFVNGKFFLRLLGNTIRLSFNQLLFGFWVPIGFALLLNEVRAARFKKMVQTASYMPYFISTVVVAGIVLSFTGSDGWVTALMRSLGMQVKDLSLTPSAFTPTYVITNIWKSFGFSSILYMSTLAAVDQELYEAARIDGASRWQQMLHISIPGIIPVIAIQLIMAVGGLLGTNSQMILLLYNEAVYKTADVFGTYVYRYGLEGGKYSFTTAVGLFTNVVNFILVFGANAISRHVLDFSLW